MSAFYKLDKVLIEGPTFVLNASYALFDPSISRDDLSPEYQQFYDIKSDTSAGGFDTYADEAAAREALGLPPPVPAWVQPTGAQDAYPIDAVVLHNGKDWISLVDANVWEPGTANWREYQGNDDLEALAWVQPTGAADAYPIDYRVQHPMGTHWISTVNGNVWEPGVSGWRQLTTNGAPPAWVQPTGAHDAYHLGDRVTHNGQVWQSTIEENVWEPGVFGWTEVI
jgi:hypothetical protein